MSETNPRLNQHTVVGETYRSKSKEKDFQSSSCGWGKADAHPQMLPDTLPLDKSQKLVVPLSLRNRLYIRRRLHEKMYYGQNHLVIIIMATSTWMEENSWRRGVRSRGPPLSALIRRLLRSFIRNDFSGAWASRVSALCPEMRTAASSSSSSSEIDFAHSTQTIRWRQRWWWGLVSLGVLYIYIYGIWSLPVSHLSSSGRSRFQPASLHYYHYASSSSPSGSLVVIIRRAVAVHPYGIGETVLSSDRVPYFSWVYPRASCV